MNKEIIQKMTEHLIKLINVADMDMTISGSCYVEFNERGMRVINPSTLMMDKKTISEKLYGESPIKPRKPKK